MLLYLALEHFQYSYPILYILFGNLQVNGHNTASFPVLFQSSKLSNHMYFKISLSLYLIDFRKIDIFWNLVVQIVIILSSEGS